MKSNCTNFLTMFLKSCYFQKRTENCVKATKKFTQKDKANIFKKVSTYHEFTPGNSKYTVYKMYTVYLQNFCRYTVYILYIDSVFTVTIYCFTELEYTLHISCQYNCLQSVFWNIALIFWYLLNYFNQLVYYLVNLLFSLTSYLLHS